jgi:hypothetical protein
MWTNDGNSLCLKMLHSLIPPPAETLAPRLWNGASARILSLLKIMVQGEFPGEQSPPVDASGHS